MKTYFSLKLPSLLYPNFLRKHFSKKKYQKVWYLNKSYQKCTQWHEMLIQKVFVSVFSIFLLTVLFFTKNQKFRNLILLFCSYLVGNVWYMVQSKLTARFVTTFLPKRLRITKKPGGTTYTVFVWFWRPLLSKKRTMKAKGCYR